MQSEVPDRTLRTSYSFLQRYPAAPSIRQPIARLLALPDALTLSPTRPTIRFFGLDLPVSSYPCDDSSPVSPRSAGT